LLSALGACALALWFRCNSVATPVARIDARLPREGSTQQHCDGLLNPLPASTEWSDPDEWAFFERINSYTATADSFSHPNNRGANS
jgi:hypothetical protein